MKIYNEDLLAKGRKLERLLYVVSLIRVFLLPLAWILRWRKNRPDFLVADGFLIGDCVLLRPLLFAMRKKGSVVYVGGSHASTLLSDIDCDRIEFQWPWASYNYSIRSIFRLVVLCARIFFLQPRATVEPRGDLRSLFFLYLCCPQHLAGYSFTGGSFALDVEPEAPGILHLETHNRLLAESLGLDYSLDDMQTPSGVQLKRVSISFSGSQPLKVLPLESARYLLLRLREKFVGYEFLYLKAPRDYFLENAQCRSLVENAGITIWSGSFQQYVSVLSQSAAYVGMDSAGGHIAAMYGVPSLLFFGTMKAEYCGPRGNQRLMSLETRMNLHCRPCAGVDCIHESRQICLSSIPEMEVDAGVAFLMEGTR